MQRQRGYTVLTLFKRLAKSKEKKTGLTIALDPAVTADLQKSLADIDRVMEKLKIDKWELQGSRKLVEKYAAILGEKV